MSQVKAGAAYVELTTRNSKFLKGLEAAKKRLERFGASTRLIGTRLMSIGTAAAAPLAGSLAVFSSFDDAMRGVKAITGATAAEFEMLRDKAKQLGATTSFSASEVASLMTELGRAGFNPKQIEDMTGSVMNLATSHRYRRDGCLRNLRCRDSSIWDGSDRRIPRCRWSDRGCQQELQQRGVAR